MNHDQVVVAMDDAHGFTQHGPLVSVAVGAGIRTRQKHFSMFDSFKNENVTGFHVYKKERLHSRTLIARVSVNDVG